MGGGGSERDKAHQVSREPQSLAGVPAGSYCHENTPQLVKTGQNSRRRGADFYGYNELCLHSEIRTFGG